MITYSSIGYYDLADSQVQSIPLDFIRSGRYSYDNGDASYRKVDGYYWQSTAHSTEKHFAHQLEFYSTYLRPYDFHNKGNGFSLRCLVR